MKGTYEVVIAGVKGRKLADAIIEWIQTHGDLGAEPWIEVRKAEPAEKPAEKKPK